MTRIIIDGLPPDAELRACFQCAHNYRVISWWCFNKEAVAWNGTQIPHFKGCRFWAPALHLQAMPWWARWLARIGLFGYVARNRP